MTAEYYQINSRTLGSYPPLPIDLDTMNTKNCLFDLSYLSVLELKGARALEFLQGQLTCDVRKVNHQQIGQGGLCNLQGRLLALVDVIDWQDKGIYLVLPSDLRDKTQKSLANVARFSDVSIEPTDKFQLFGFIYCKKDDKIPFDLTLKAQHLSAIHGDNYFCYALGNQTYIYLVCKEKAPVISESFKKSAQWCGSLQWHALQLQKKNIQIYEASRGLFLLHRLGLQHTNYLSLDKGCYKGQEIIARTHYRAKLKHELRIFITQTDEPLQSGQRLLNDTNDLEIGELIDFCPLKKDTFLIAASVLFEHPSTIRFDNHKKPVNLLRF